MKRKVREFLLNKLLAFSFWLLAAFDCGKPTTIYLKSSGDNYEILEIDLC